MNNVAFEAVGYGTATGYGAGVLALTFALAASSDRPVRLFEKRSGNA